MQAVFCTRHFFSFDLTSFGEKTGEQHKKVPFLGGQKRKLENKQKKEEKRPTYLNTICGH